ncbi:MAG: MipA/OmpV family protein [Sphingomonadales bacterium]
MKTLTTVLALSLSCAAPALAQQPPIQQGEWRVTLGAAAVVGPQYLGDTSARILPIPYIDVQYGPNYFLNVPRGLGAYLATFGDGDSQLRWGVSLTPNFNGRESDDIPGLPSVGIAIEAQSFLEYSYKNWSLGLTVAQDLGTGHEGFFADVSAGYGSRLGDRGFGRIGLTARYADSVYMESFYEVTPTQAAISDLNAFDINSGFESVAVNGLYTYQISDHWQFALVPEVRLAIGDVRTSPITEDNFGYQVVSVIGYQF